MAHAAWPSSARGFHRRVPSRRARTARASRKSCRRNLWPGTGTDKPLEIVRGAIKEAKLSASDVILVDTAGRLHIDDELMNELTISRKSCSPAKFCSSLTP